MNDQLSILLIEDRAADVVLIQNSLEDFLTRPFSLHCAKELADGLKQLSETQFDLVITDLTLPDSIGLDTFLAVREHAANIPIVVLTGLADDELATRAVSLGAQDFVNKQFIGGPVLATAIRHALERFRVISERDQQRAQMQSVIESNLDAMLVVDRQGNVRFNNPAAEVLLGAESGQLVGRQFGVASSTGQVDELQFPGANGEPLVSELRSAPIVWQGESCDLLSLRDITERKRAQADREARMQAEHELRLAQTEIGMAWKVQQRLLPGRAPDLPGFDIAGICQPAAQCSGDFFDFIPLADNRWAFVVADVTGHGFGPAIVAATVHSHLRAVAELGKDAREMLSVSNRLISRETAAGTFVTLGCLQLDPARKSMTFAGAGHPAWMVDAGGETKTIEATAIPLGLDEDFEVPLSLPQALEVGDVVLLMSDGVWETQDWDEDIFGTQRTMELVRAERHKSASEIIQSLYETPRDFAGTRPPDDDFTVVVIKRV